MPSAERPRSGMAATLGTVRSWLVTAVSAATSAAVSGAPDRAATTGIGCRFVVPKGAARAAACVLGALAGRNLVLLFWVTLDSAGRNVTAANTPAIHTSTTSQRNVTVKRPMAPKTVSTCTRRPYAIRVHSRVAGSAVSQVAPVRAAARRDDATNSPGNALTQGTGLPDTGGHPEVMM